MIHFLKIFFPQLISKEKRIHMQNKPNNLLIQNNLFFHDFSMTIKSSLIPETLNFGYKAGFSFIQFCSSLTIMHTQTHTCDHGWSLLFFRASKSECSGPGDGIQKLKKCQAAEDTLLKRLLTHIHTKMPFPLHTTTLISRCYGFHPVSGLWNTSALIKQRGCWLVVRGGRGSRDLQIRTGMEQNLWPDSLFCQLHTCIHLFGFITINNVYTSFTPVLP